MSKNDQVFLPSGKTVFLDEVENQLRESLVAYIVKAFWDFDFDVLQSGTKEAIEEKRELKNYFDKEVQ